MIFLKEYLLFLKTLIYYIIIIVGIVLIILFTDLIVKTGVDIIVFIEMKDIFVIIVEGKVVINDVFV